MADDIELWGIKIHPHSFCDPFFFSVEISDGFDCLEMHREIWQHFFIKFKVIQVCTQVRRNIIVFYCPYTGEPVSPYRRKNFIFDEWCRTVIPDIKDMEMPCPSELGFTNCNIFRGFDSLSVQVIAETLVEFTEVLIKSVGVCYIFFIGKGTPPYFSGICDICSHNLPDSFHGLF